MDIDADAAVGDNFETLGLHLLDASIYDPLFQLEVRNSVSEQSADTIRPLVERHRMSGARELLRAGEPCGPEPTTATRFAGFARAGSGSIHFSAHA